ncbi:UDP-2,3-diacylglucosamine diphosphatase [Chitinivorax tropicus]|uniref:UDP-2,3-diacylglucosamine hydrolase n=1 Tax=Chitinivorax tropicus TaxID=714531 RepID=A0A840MM68_9PROT|nr:UDP-2,3-diacylglucosamine diphosphatase [Chitinivorax tropicus]MBB5019510.1 UDP-2,3-diacylglucosamine diphosphatase [Chitinivorax tropicus]
MKPIYFISDLHLTPDEPATVALFQQFCEEHAKHAGALYILGDFFEYWAGDDDLAAPFNQQVTGQLHALSQQGIQIYLQHGNRDFLLGAQFAEQAGLTLLPDPYPLTLNGLSLVLSHGDALCTDDVEYQQFRTMVRNPQWLGQFLQQPLAARKAVIEQIRQKSEMAKQSKATAIMDVNRQAVLSLLSETRCDWLIHGHTHRPGRHVYPVADKQAIRMVLPDWYGGAGGYLVFDEQGWQLRHYGPERPPTCLFETARTLVRELRRSDLDALTRLCANPQTIAFMGDGKPLDDATVRYWIERLMLGYERWQYGTFAVMDRSSDTMIGFVGISSPTDQPRELIYAFEPSVWGQGLATEVGQAFLAYAQANWLITDLQASVAAEHLASARVLAKLGFQYLREEQDDQGTVCHYQWRA